MSSKKSAGKIMIIEDDAALATMYGERLSQEGYAVTWCSNGAKGVHHVLLEKPDLILLDLFLPDKGGLGIMQILRTLPQTKNLPVIILTAYPKQEYIDAANRCGAAAFYSKADTLPKKIIETVNKIVARNTVSSLSPRR